MAAVTNRLAGAISPYLQQHAGNPVAWFEWGPEAFEEARRRDVPVFLSVGYAACHWCHVMAHESFEDPATAAQLNADFVSIKVDREERPDVDAVYMAATTALTGAGGWPMSVWLDHEGRAFLTGTYFPPVPMHGRASFRQILAAVTDAWRTRRADVTRSAAAIQQALLERESVGYAGAGSDAASVIEEAAAELTSEFDQQYAGFGGAPKFPPAMMCEFLLRHYELTGSRQSLEMVARTCEAMARGGIYDQLGGGFARYSVDDHWRVPHFEKMLYDNALLLRLYTHWFCRTDSDLARRIAAETADFIVRDLGTAEGGFAAALDADSAPPDDPGGTPVEGAAYVWSPDELDSVLGPEDGEWAAQLLDVTVAGSFEHGRSTLILATDADDPRRWEQIRSRLKEARDQRPQPARDDKVVASWNGLAITALAQAGIVFDRADWVAAAVRAGELLAERHVTEQGRLLRVSRAGRVGSAAGVLDDYGNVVEAFATLFAVTGELRWFRAARTLTDVMVAEFATGPDSFADTAADSEQLVRRPRDPADNASPGGTAAAVTALVIMAALTGDQQMRARAERTLQALSELQRTHPRFAGWSLTALAATVAGPAQVAIAGPGDEPLTRDLLRAAFRYGRAGAVIATSIDGEPGSEVALLRDRAGAERPTAFVCHDFVCRLPVTTAEELAEQLEQPAAAG